MTDVVLRRLTQVDDGRWTWLGVRADEPRTCTVVTDDAGAVVEVHDGAPPRTPTDRSPPVVASSAVPSDDTPDVAPTSPSARARPAAPPRRPVAARPTGPSPARAAVVLLVLLCSALASTALLIAVDRGIAPTVASGQLLAGLAAAATATTLVAGTTTDDGGGVTGLLDALGRRVARPGRWRHGRRDDERGVLQEV